ncbi:MAG: hypothetical protein ABFC96_16575 [Thermoguttaceae bacterium]
MFTMTLVCLGVAASILVGLIVYPTVALARAARAQLSPQALTPQYALRLGAAVLCSRSRREETRVQKALRSWSGTMVICAGICMIGVLLETHYNSTISLKSIVSGLVPQRRVSVQACLPRVHRAKPATAKRTPTSTTKVSQAAKQQKSSEPLPQPKSIN